MHVPINMLQSSSPAAHLCSVLLPHASVSPWDWTASIPWGCTVLHGDTQEDSLPGWVPYSITGSQPGANPYLTSWDTCQALAVWNQTYPCPTPCASTLGSMSHSYLSPHPSGDTCCPLKHHYGDRHGPSGALNRLLVACREGEAHLAWVWLGIRIDLISLKEM